MVKTSSAIRFKAKLCRPAEGGAWTFLRLPQAASDQVHTRSMASVEGVFNGIGFTGALQPDGEGGHWLKVEPGLREAACASVGDFVELQISPVAVEPEPEVPEDLREALSNTPAALAVWTKTTPLARRDWISWLTSGKKAETRTIRLEKMMDMLAKGKKRICCFDRSGIASKGFSCPSEAADSLEL